MIKFNRGFTLIELLVVIAIIGILSAVVLSSLNTARAKSADAAIKSNLSNMRSQAELLYDAATGTNGYNQVCADNSISAMKAAAESASGTTLTCRNAVGYWVAWIRLKTDSTKAWCVDYQGNSRQISVPGTINSCP